MLRRLSSGLINRASVFTRIGSVYIRCTYHTDQESIILALSSARAHLSKSLTRFQCTSSARQCWKCGAHLSSAESTLYFCPNSNCRALQPVSESTSYFELLGIPENFSIHDALLTKNYRTIINQLHPDKVLHLDQEQKQIADTQSTLINNAYRTLQKPIPRALYMLQRHGKTIEESDLHLGNEFLMDMLEFNELVVETNDSDELTKLFNENRAKIQTVLTALGNALDDRNHEDALELVAQAKYLMNIENQIKEKTYLH